MAFTKRSSMAMALLAVLVFALCSGITEATNIGAVYGRNGDNIPSAATAAALMQQYEISRVRIYDHDTSVIQAFASTQIRVMISVTNDEITPIGLSQASADDWVNKYVAPYIQLTNINAIAVGSEVITNSPSISSLLVPAMQNIHTSLVKLGYDSSIKVSSPHGIGLLDVSYPPSAGQFGSSITATVHSMLDFLQQTGAPFMINVYPFLAYLNSVSTVPLDYALFQPATPVVDGNNGLVYYSLYDAQIDAMIAAMSKVNKSVAVTVTETGWPSDGESPAGYANAKTYNQNLVKRTMNNSGTPMRPNVEIDAYIVSLYDEDLRQTPPLFNQHWGLFYANGTYKYGFSFLNGTDVYGGGGGGGGTYPPGTPSPPGTPPSPPGTPGTPGGGGGGAIPGQKVWCVAKASASNNSLQQGIDWACGAGKAKCDPIQPGGSCYLPNTEFSHASYAFNIHYHWFQTDPRSCIFGGDAELTYVDPSA
ncbi:hypothetical protein M758_3G250800 [Ceratodon purpureus]|uniref:glucan endo-1,3-beta-D-glucosidase n=1 Tax=Ceratodon purpureus TaxID=3225 RepID=A0A8T0IPR7_CERPU|nr:hypothetical protein KC19_3G250200 [Ceratodon purpureus]KAG0624475.1 hypothetical protein M758_3G250800 [Ceratodon purpureus]